MRPLPNSVKKMDNYSLYKVDASSSIDRINRKEVLVIIVMGFNDNIVSIAPTVNMIMDYTGRDSSIPSLLRELSRMFNCVVNYEK